MSDEAVVESENPERWVFVAPEDRGLTFKLSSGKVKFNNGQLILTKKKDADELRELMRTNPAFSSKIKFVDEKLAAEVSKQFQRRQASLGGTNTDTISDMARAILSERDLRLHNIRNNAEAAKELEAAQSGVEGVTLTEESQGTPVDHSPEGFTPVKPQDVETGDDTASEEQQNPVSDVLASLINTNGQQS